MPDLPLSVPPPRRWSATLVLPTVLCCTLGWWLGWLLRAGQRDNAALRGEITGLRVALRAAESREGLIADAQQRAQRLEETLELMRRAPVPAAPESAPALPAPPAPPTADALELERVITFLREEINAAHETIERLKQSEPESKPASSTRRARSKG